MTDQNEMTCRVVLSSATPSIYPCTPDPRKRHDTAGLKRNDHLCMFSCVLRANQIRTNVRVLVYAGGDKTGVSNICHFHMILSAMISTCYISHYWP
jgi:hypothetical protein